MLKVFLAEDEFIVREGIRNNIDWRSEGFDFCGDAPDGELAYPMILERKPDILITDIRMPFMDGLSLCRLVSHTLPTCRMVILSGHEEFAYAKEALHIGVSDYLLKPITGAELLSVIKRLGDKILEERQVQAAAASAASRESESASSTGPEAMLHTENLQEEELAEVIGGFSMRDIEHFLRNGEGEQVVSFSDEFYQKNIAKGADSYFFQKYVQMNLIQAVNAFLREIGEESPGGGIEEDHLRDVLAPVADLRTLLRTLLSDAMEKRDQRRSGKYRRLIEQAKSFMQLRYADESLSLNDVAAHVNLSPNHFSAVFSRETGSSFIRHLTDLRMAKAVELLKCTDLRCSDVGFAVGYKDPHYFSYLFKKLQGMTPMQCRSAGGDALLSRK